MTSKMRLALGFAALAALILALGAASLRLLTNAAHEPAEWLTVATLLGGCLAATAWLAFASLRGHAERLPPVAIATPASVPPPLLVAPEPSAVVAERNPYADRRGPNRAANVVRPTFGQSAPDRGPAAPNPAGPPGDWEAF